MFRLSFEFSQLRLMLLRLSAIGLLISSTEARAASVVLDPTLTPGHAASTDIAEVCSPVVKHTRIARSARAAVLDSYGLSAATHEFHVVRLIPPSWGGDDTIENLLPMDPTDERLKANLAWKGHQEICAGRLDLKTAQTDIATNWRAMYNRLCHEPGSCNFEPRRRR